MARAKSSAKPAPKPKPKPAPKPRRPSILFAASEAAPFCKTGGLGDVAGSLPQALAKAGCRVAVMIPKYATIPQAYKERMEHICDFYLPLAWRNAYCGLERLVEDGVEYYFVDNEGYFKRDELYGCFDDGERFAFFSKAITESIPHLPDFHCDIIHCNDWQTALVPAFLREFYQSIEAYRDIKCVFTVHNVKFQGSYNEVVLGDICGLSGFDRAVWALTSAPRTINYLKGALFYSDLVTTVSPTYAEELKTFEYGEGLDYMFRERTGDLVGILNGIDVAANDPATDPLISANFTAQELSSKARCKAAIQEELGLRVDPAAPLIAMITRLTSQKGLDLVQYGLEPLLNRGYQMIILGTGDQEYENTLRYFDWRYPETMAAVITFDPALSKRIYAGADMFLMPSVFEPCGISQMYAMAYGTLPIVRETGGLKDSVTPYREGVQDANGFSFPDVNGDEMINCTIQAAELFLHDKATWTAMQIQAMETDFSWDRSVERYLELYRRLRPDRF